MTKPRPTAEIAALLRDLRTVTNLPTDDPRPRTWQARKVALLARLEGRAA